MRCAVLIGPERSSSPPYARWTTPKDPWHSGSTLPLKPLWQGGEGDPGRKPVSCLTTQVTVIGQGPACAGMLMLNVRVLLFGLFDARPVQFPPGVAVSWTMLRSAMVESNLTLRVALQL